METEGHNCKLSAIQMGLISHKANINVNCYRPTFMCSFAC